MDVDGHVAASVSVVESGDVILNNIRILEGWAGSDDDGYVRSEKTGKTYIIHLQNSKPMSGEWKYKAIQKLKEMLPDIEEWHERGQD